MKQRKLIVLFMVMMLIFNSIPSLPVSAENQSTTTTYSKDNMLIEYTVDEVWNQSKRISIRVTNIGNEDLNQWAFKLKVDGEISGVWDAEFSKDDDNNYVFRNKTYNAFINSNESLEFGFILTGDNLLTPETIDYVIVENEVKTDDYNVELVIHNSWTGGFSGNLIINNKSEKPICGWKLELETDFEISSLSNGRINNISDKKYTILSDINNSILPSNDKITCGIIGECASVPELKSYQLMEKVVGEVSNEDNSEEDDKSIVNWDEMLDTDSDGLPDEVEIEYNTDYLNPDTDGDGLLDGYEVLSTYTDPAVFDTYNLGISDGEVDLDEDGLTNIEEANLGTDPMVNDSDCDGLFDGEEVNKYKTLPLVYDTDGDGISDGDEIYLGLDPTNPKTHGYPDNEYISKQDIDANNKMLEDINTVDNPMKLSLLVESTGNAMSSLAVKESRYATSVLKNEAVIGNVISITAKDMTLENMEVRFSVDKDYLENVDCHYSNISELDGIKKYQIFYMDKEKNDLVPVDTMYDIENNSLYTTTINQGDYCVMDMDQWFSSLGIELEEKTNVPQAKQIAAINGSTIPTDQLDDNYLIYKNTSKKNIMTFSNQVEKADSIAMKANSNVKLTGPVDIVFIVDCTGTIEPDTFNNILENITSAAKEIYNDYTVARISIIKFTDWRKEPTEILKVNNQPWATNLTDFQKLSDQLSQNRTLTESGMGDGLYEMLINTNFEPRAARFAFLFNDGPSFGTIRGWDNSLSYFNEIYNAAINTSNLMSSNSYFTEESFMYQFLNNTGGIVANTELNFGPIIAKHVYSETKARMHFMLAGNKAIIDLKSPLIKGGTTDSDGDGLTDSEEVMWSIMGWPKMLNMYDYLSHYDRYSKMFGQLTDESKYNLKSTKILYTYSNPADPDCDKDGILDGDEQKYKLDAHASDTVESMFPELLDPKGPNKKTNKVYLDIKGNDIVINANIKFNKEAYELASDLLVHESAIQPSYNYQAKEDDKVWSRLLSKTVGKGFTYVDIFEDAINARWCGTFNGSDYDFYKGMEINVKTNFNFNPTKNENKIKISINTKKGDTAYVFYGLSKWKTNNTGSMKLCVAPSKEEYKNNELFSPVRISGTMAHEFGHILGLDDAYESYKEHRRAKILNNVEIYYDERYRRYPAAGEVMYSNGVALPNDIEMVLYAFNENRSQVFIPSEPEIFVSDAKCILSEAIRYNLAYQKINPKGICEPGIYYWDRKSRRYIL